MQPPYEFFPLKLLLQLSHALALRACRINPIWYVQQALAINEFRAPRWQVNLAANGMTVGDAVLTQRGLFTDEWWIWLAVGVLVFTQIIGNLLVWILSAWLGRMPQPCSSLCWRMGCCAAPLACLREFEADVAQSKCLLPCAVWRMLSQPLY